MKNFEVMTQDEMEQVNGGMIRLLIYFFKFVRLCVKYSDHGSYSGNDPRYEYNDATRVAR